MSNNTGIFNSCTWLWLTESEQILRGLNKGCGLKFCIDVRQKTPGEGQRTYQPKHCEYNNKDNSLKTLNDKKRQALSQKFRHLTALIVCGLQRILF